MGFNKVFGERIWFYQLKVDLIGHLAVQAFLDVLFTCFLQLSVVTRIGKLVIC